MAICGRVWAIPITVAFAAVSAGPLAAAPPLMSPDAIQRRDTWKLPEINPAPPRSRAETSLQDVSEGSQKAISIDAHVPEVPSGPSDRVPPSLDPPTSLGQQSMASNLHDGSGVAAAEFRKDVSWVAVLGEVARPGSYEVGGDSMTLAELMGRCEGLVSEAECAISIIRDGRYWGSPQSAQEVLWPGDLVVVTAPQTGALSQDVRIGIVGLPGSPAAVMIPRAYATVDGILKLSGQNQIRPSDIKVLLGGTRETSGDRVIELTQGSVLVFDSQRLPATPNLDLRSLTYFYPAPKMPSRYASSSLSQISLEAQDQRATDSTASMSGDLRPYGQPKSLVGSELGATLNELPSGLPVNATDISALPSIEFLEPPAETLPLNFPRTADASGTIPIGAPSAESHIVPMPVDAGAGFGDTEQTSPEQKIPKPIPQVKSRPKPIELPDEEAIEADDPSAADLAPTVLIGAVLGALTFFGIRQLRTREILPAIRTRLLAIANRGHDTPETVTVTVSTAPSDILASLIADRLAFREEPVQFPETMRVYGRSPALHRRRVDPVAASLAGPHFKVQDAPSVRNQSVSDHEPTSSHLRGSKLRVDGAQGLKRSAAKPVAGTPFERALASLQDKDY